MFDNIGNVNYNGPKPHGEIAAIFRASQAIYHEPIVNEPFCRMVAEGLLCGVREVIGAPEKIGSYLEFQKVGREEFCQTMFSRHREFLE